MTIELITGGDGTAHISSADDGDLYASIVGTGQYGTAVGQGLALTVVDNNNLTLGTGFLWHNGRGVRVAGQEAVKVASGSQGKARRDLVVARYSRAADGIERETVEVIRGAEVDATQTPADPAHETGSVLDAGTTVSDVPLWRVRISGLAIEGTDRLFATVPSLSDVPDASRLSTGTVPAARISGLTRANVSTATATQGGGIFTSNNMRSGGLTDVRFDALYGLHPGTYLVMPTASGSPCSGTYGNLLVGWSGGNRIVALLTSDDGRHWAAYGAVKYGGGSDANWMRLAPANHASTSTTYGAATLTNYGHVRLTGTVPYQSSEKPDDLGAAVTYQAVRSAISALAKDFVLPQKFMDTTTGSRVRVVATRAGKVVSLQVFRTDTSSTIDVTVPGVRLATLPAGSRPPASAWAMASFVAGGLNLCVYVFVQSDGGVYVASPFGEIKGTVKRFYASLTYVATA